MIPIYQKDGTIKYYNESEVELIKINSETISELKNHNNGVNIYLKDGSIKYIDNAITDGFGIEIK